MAAEMQASARAQAPESTHQSQLAFHLTGRRSSIELEALQGPALRPALLARCRELSALRYDFPLVLRAGSDKDYVHCLSGMIDAVIHEIAREEDADHLTRHLLRLEREMRVLAAGGAKGSLTQLWDSAAERVAAGGDALLRRESQARREALKLDGEVADCDRELPGRLLAHAWRVCSRRRCARVSRTSSACGSGLPTFLRLTGCARAPGAHPPACKRRLVRSMPTCSTSMRMSRVLASSTSATSLAESRRQRIEKLLFLFDSQRFFPLDDAPNSAIGATPSSSRAARVRLAAYRQRQPLAEELAKAIAVAELEVSGEYNETRTTRSLPAARWCRTRWRASRITGFA